jgi:hypothetical protein
MRPTLIHLTLGVTMIRLAASLICCLVLAIASVRADDGPVARWKLADDAKDSAGQHHGKPHDVEFADGSAVFNGRNSHIAIPAKDDLKLGTGDFTISLWVETAEDLDDDLGDLVSQFDPATRTGFHLSLRNNTGVTHSQANSRQLQFGIDAGTEPVFTNEGRPGNSIFGQSMAALNGQLYVGTCVAGENEAGRVYQYDGTNQWIDCGAPDKANSITAMCADFPTLYVGTGKYRLGGSALSESENPNLGGKVFAHLGGDQWETLGHFPEMEAVGGMVVFRGKLYVSSLYKPAEFYRHDGNRQWTKLSVPNGKRVEALGVFNGFLWATGYDEGHVYRFDGEKWTDLGRVGEEDNTQTYAFATYQGQLQVATWRTGKVFAWENDAWQDRGRLGEELEVMGMLIHNGCLYGGTLPLGQIYRYDGDQSWTLLKQLDTTPDVKYRRVWTMAQHDGKLFATTLPSGNVWSMQTGACVTWDNWSEAKDRTRFHVAAQRQGDSVRLFVDGVLVAESKAGKAGAFDLSTGEPWRIGAGSGDRFHGKLSDVQVFRRALSAKEIVKLAEPEA